KPFVGGNDTIATAHDLGDVTGTWIGRSGTTEFRSNSYNFGCGSSARDAVFRFSLSAPQRTMITLRDSSFNTVLTVLDATTLTGWCDNDGAPGNTSELELDLPAGDWLIVVDGAFNQTGDYSLMVGDRCAHPDSV